jgi:hypothetical protein
MKIIKVNYNQGEYTEGCETCDYGSSYITNLEIITDYCKISFECDTMYDYISESDLMQFLAQDFVAEWELVQKFKKQFIDEDDEDVNISIKKF